MAMLLGALRGMAVAGIEPGPLLGWLNQLLDASVQPALGSALCCRYDPDTRRSPGRRQATPPRCCSATGRGVR